MQGLLDELDARDQNKVLNFLRDFIKALKALFGGTNQEIEYLENLYAKNLTEVTAEKQSGGNRYSLSPTKIQNLSDIIYDLGKKGIVLNAGGRFIKVTTDKYTVNKNIFSQKGRSNNEVNARIKAIPEYENLLRNSEYKGTDTQIIDLDKKAKKGVRGMIKFVTEYNGYIVEFLIRDKGSTTPLYEAKFINKKSYQQSMSNKNDSTASKEDVGNDNRITNSSENVNSKFSIPNKDVENSESQVLKNSSNYGIFESNESKTKEKLNYNENEFRRIQEASFRLSDKDIQSYHNGGKQLDERIRERFAGVLSRKLSAQRSRLRYDDTSLVNPKTNTTIKLYSNIDGKTFHDIFQVIQNYLPSGDAVDVHETMFYQNTKNYLSSNGLSGFAITEDGDLVSVFNLGESGFLKTIRDFVKQEGAKTLDCYQSRKQPLAKIYSKTIGFKTASLLDFNYDILAEEKGKEYADYFVKTYGEAPVAFMVLTDEDVQTKRFSKTEYDEAYNYRESFVDRSDGSNSTETRFSIPDEQRALLDRFNNGEITEEEFQKEMAKLVERAKSTYGTIERGENPTNDVSVPKAVSNDRKTKRFVRTALEEAGTFALIPCFLSKNIDFFE